MFTGVYVHKTIGDTNHMVSSHTTTNNSLPTRTLDLVPKVRSDAIQEWFGRLPGSIGIGNVRYTTSGKCDDVSIIDGTQPVVASSRRNKSCTLIQRQHRQYIATKKRNDSKLLRFPLQLRLRHSLSQNALWAQSRAKAWSLQHAPSWKAWMEHSQ